MIEDTPSDGGKICGDFPDPTRLDKAAKLIDPASTSPIDGTVRDSIVVGAMVFTPTQEGFPLYIGEPAFIETSTSVIAVESIRFCPYSFPPHFHLKPESVSNKS
jgi:hypothetical protein